MLKPYIHLENILIIMKYKHKLEKLLTRQRSWENAIKTYQASTTKPGSKKK